MRAAARDYSYITSARPVARFKDENSRIYTNLLEALNFVRIRVIRVFTAAFPRRVFGRPDRRAGSPRKDQA